MKTENQVKDILIKKYQRQHKIERWLANVTVEDMEDIDRLNSELKYLLVEILLLKEILDINNKTD